MEHQSSPAFTTEDTVVAIILSMRALGLHTILSPDFHQQDVESLMARVHSILQQGQGPRRGSIAATLRQKYELIHTARAQRRAEADLEAADVATYDQTPDTAPDPDQSQEIAEANAYVAGEEALAAEEDQRLAEHEEAEAANFSCSYDSDDYYDGGYNTDADQCGCHSAFGKDDDGEVRHYGLNCKYRGF